MKILLVVEDLRINTTSAGICNSNIIASLLKFNHNINCVYDYAESNSFPWLKNSLIKFTKINEPKITLLEKLVLKFPKINSIYAYTTGFNATQSQKINTWKKSIEQNLTNNSYDFILLLGAGNSMLNYFAMSNIKTKIPYVVNYHDPYPGNQYPKPYQEKNSWVLKLKAKQSNRVINNAFKVSFPSQRLYEWMLQYHHNLKKKSIILPHPNGELQNLPSKPEDDTINLDTKKFNIIHAGSLLGHRNPVYLINAFKRFIESDIEKKEMTMLSIVGKIAKNNELLKISQLTDKIKVISERISYKKSKLLFEQANVLLIIESKAEDSPFMPGKLTDYIAANKTIMALTPQKSEVSRILGYNYPFISDIDNEDKIVSIFNSLWELWKNDKLNDNQNIALIDYVSASNFNSQLCDIFKK
jgi:glycosyltransferase involved in cell wall biosynthesis